MNRWMDEVHRLLHMALNKVDPGSLAPGHDSAYVRASASLAACTIYEGKEKKHS